MIAAALAAVAIGGTAQAQTDPQSRPQPQAAYPAAVAELSAWLRQSTDLPPEQVVAVSASAATAIVARTPSAGGRTEARLRAVAITPEAAARSGVLAWEMRLDVDCRSGQVLTGATTGYATRRASAEGGVPLAAADTTWRRPKPNTTLDAAWRAVCDAKFQPPLASPQSRIAQAPPAQPAPPAARAAAPAPMLARSTPRVSRPPPRQTPTSLPVASTPQASRAAAKTAPPPARVEKVKATQAAVTTARSSAIKGGGRAGVQVLSSPVEAEARQKLARLQHRFGASVPGIQGRIVPAQVRGRTVYRGVLAGFATPGDARAFCRTLKQGGQSCLTL